LQTSVNCCTIYNFVTAQIK